MVRAKQKGEGCDQSLEVSRAGGSEQVMGADGDRGKPAPRCESSVGGGGRAQAGEVFAIPTWTSTVHGDEEDQLETLQCLISQTLSAYTLEVHQPAQETVRPSSPGTLII